MGRISQSRASKYWRIADTGKTVAEQGKALEDLICYVFGKIPGISVRKRNVLNIFGTEEVDVALWNEKDQNGLSFLPYILLVECKNWSKALDSAEVSWFDTKLRNRGLTFGVLVAAKGITGNPARLTAAYSIIAGALREQRNIVVFTRAEIQATKNTDQIVRLFKEKLCDLALVGTAVP